MPTTIAFVPSEIATWNIRNRALGIIWNADFLAVAGFSALGLLLTLSFILRS